MKKTLVILAGGLLLTSAAAMADPPQHHRGQSSHKDRGHHGDDHGKYDRHDNGFSRDRYGEHDSHGHYYVVHDRGRHEGWYKKGGRVPVEYRSSRYIVTDWRTYHLRQPPRGYAWVRSDNNEYLLIAIATGIIADILLSQ